MEAVSISREWSYRAGAAGFALLLLFGLLSF